MSQEAGDRATHGPDYIRMTGPSLTRGCGRCHARPQASFHSGSVPRAICFVAREHEPREDSRGQAPGCGGPRNPSRANGPCLRRPRREEKRPSSSPLRTRARGSQKLSVASGPGAVGGWQVSRCAKRTMVVPLKPSCERAWMGGSASPDLLMVHVQPWTPRWPFGRRSVLGEAQGSEVRPTRQRTLSERPSSRTRASTSWDGRRSSW
jgi:hypothetical protein